MLVVYRDDGYWILTWYRIYRRLIGGRVRNLPGPGFVGRASGSFLGTGRRHARLVSTQMRRLRSTPDAQLWRLTCVWELSPGFLGRIRYGSY